MRTISSTLPFVQARHTLGSQKPKTIELRSSFTTSDSGAALGLANYWHSDLSFKHPSHYVVDETAVYQCVPDNVMVDSFNGAKKGVLLITVCSEPLSNVKQWYDQSHQQVLTRTISLIRELARTYHIPLRYVDDTSQKRWYQFKFRRHGIVINITGIWPYELTFLS